GHADYCRARWPRTRPQSLLDSRWLRAGNDCPAGARSGADLPAPDQLQFRRCTMSTGVAVTPSAPTTTRLHSARPSFIGIVRGEVFKVSRQISTWVLAVLYLGAICMPYLILLASNRIKTDVRDDPMSALYSVLGVDMLVLKVFGGAFIIIVT